MTRDQYRTFRKRARTGLAALVLLPGVLAQAAIAQNNSLRGLSDATPNRLPTAQQQLDQNRNRQQSGFSTRQQLDGAERLNRTDQINRQNTRPGLGGTPCPGPNESCRTEE